MKTDGKIMKNKFPFWKSNENNWNNAIKLSLGIGLISLYYKEQITKT